MLHSSISEKVIPRISVYCLICLVFVSLLVRQIFSLNFNADEYQHTYLAWASLNFNQLIFKDIFDNHGIVYFLLNRGALLLFDPVAGLDTLLLLRKVNLSIISLTFIIYAEIFKVLTGRWSIAALAAVLFSLSSISKHCLEIRPDNLMNLFFALGVLALVFAWKVKERKLLLLFCGISFGLMMLTNIKSLAIIAALFLALIVAPHDQFRTKLNFIIQVFIGWCLITMLAVILFAQYEMLEQYIRNCLTLNFIFAFQVPKVAPLKASGEIYFTKDLYLTVLMMLSYLSWVVSIRYCLTTSSLRFILAFIIIASLALGKIANLWTQYDLIFIIPLSFISGIFVYSSIDFIFKLPTLFNWNLKRANLLTILFFSLIGCSLFVYKFSLVSSLDRHHSLAHIDTLLVDLYSNLEPGEMVESFNANSPGFGFFKHASYNIFKYDKLIKAIRIMEEDEGLFNQDYIKTLSQQKVRYIFGDRNITSSLGSQAKDYVLKNYRFKDNYWERLSPYGGVRNGKGASQKSSDSQVVCYLLKAWAFFTSSRNS